MCRARSRSRRSRNAEIQGRRIVLIDDVLTSGATVDACARALLRAKAAQVDVLVFARVVDTSKLPYNSGSSYPIHEARAMAANIEIYTRPGLRLLQRGQVAC